MSSSGVNVRDARVWIDAYTHMRADRLDADFFCPFEGTIDGYTDRETAPDRVYWECPTCGHEGEVPL